MHELIDLQRWWDRAPPAIDWSALRRALGPDSHVVVITTLGPILRSQVFISSPGQSLRSRVIDTDPDFTLARAIEEVTANSGGARPAVTGLLRWLGETVPAGAPLALVVPTELRAAGLHALDVGGSPLAIRNPVFYAPAGGRVVVGMPVLAPTAGTAGNGPVAIQDEPELRGLRSERLLWDRAATVQNTVRAMSRARRVHISAHGRLDPLEPARSGVLLAHGEVLTLESTRKLRLAGPLVILSACESGRRAQTAYSGTPALDLGFVGAGASTVISTPWRPNARAAALWMGVLHRELDAGATAAEAARRAYQATRRSFADPQDWAAFSVLGLATNRY
jgi:hypothetical protein